MCYWFLQVLVSLITADQCGQNIVTGSIDTITLTGIGNESGCTWDQCFGTSYYKAEQFHWIK